MLFEVDYAKNYASILYQCLFRSIDSYTLFYTFTVPTLVYLDYEGVSKPTWCHWYLLVVVGQAELVHKQRQCHYLKRNSDTDSPLVGIATTCLYF